MAVSADGFARYAPPPTPSRESGFAADETRAGRQCRDGHGAGRALSRRARGLPRRALRCLRTRQYRLRTWQGCLRTPPFFGNAGAVAGGGSVAGLVGAFGCDQAFGVQHALAHRLEAVPSIRVVSRFGCTSSDHLRAPFSIMRQNRAFLATEPRSGTSRYDSLRFRHRRKAKKVGKARKPQVTRAPSERAKESPCQNSVPWPKTGAFAARPVARPTARRAQPGPPSSVRQPPEKRLDENRPEETPEPRTHPGAAREKPRPERKKGERGRAEAKAGPELGLAGTSRTEPGRARAEAELGPAWPGRDRSRIGAGPGLKSG